MPKSDHNRQHLRDTLQGIAAGSRVFVCGHTRPDGDAIGSVLALQRALLARGVDATPVLADNGSVPEPYLWMAGSDAYQRPDQLTGQRADYFITLDTPDFGRLAEAGPLLLAAQYSLIIDHHPPLQENYADLRYVQEDAASCGQLVWNLLHEMQWSCDPDIATACYVATISDTGSFQFSNTTQQTFRAVGEMIASGARPADIAAKLYNQKPLAALQLEGRILSRAKLLNGGAVIHSYLSDADLQELGVANDWTEDLVDLIRCVRDTEVALFITQSSKGPRLSLRSGSGFDVSEVARQFGGGGHKAAAGITWSDKSASLEQILDAVLPQLPCRSGKDCSETALWDSDWKIVEP
ncbi:MAG: DHH family phosphoesterase [Coriobacteriia bacterium]|nr:DHH family phosphoesterase [Coriobacteriia bacterium]